MNQFVFLGSSGHYSVTDPDEIIDVREKFGSVSVEDTASYAHVGHNSGDYAMRFSKSVHRRFVAGLVFLLISGMFSLVSVVLELKAIGAVGAFFLAASFVSFVLWLEVADAEQRKSH